MTPVRLEHAAIRSRVKHSTTEPLRSLKLSIAICIRSWVIILPTILAHVTFETAAIWLGLALPSECLVDALPLFD